MTSESVNQKSKTVASEMLVVLISPLTISAFFMPAIFLHALIASAFLNSIPTDLFTLNSFGDYCNGIIISASKIVENICLTKIGKLKYFFNYVIWN